jgi:hypothetical protein
MKVNKNEPKISRGQKTQQTTEEVLKEIWQNF